MKKKKPRFDPTEQKGVNAIESIVLNDFGWIFRQQLIADMGIDAHIEYVDGNPTGKLIGLQIKSGPSHVAEKADRFVFRGKLEHLDYWLSNSLPVVLVIYLPKRGAFWQLVDASTVVRTKKNWKIDIPLKHRFGKPSKGALSDLFDGTPKQQKLRRLALDEPLMKHIAGRGKVVLEMEDWINKSLGRSPVNIYVIDKDGTPRLSRAYGVMYTGYKVEQVAQRLFPWARIQIDEEFYEERKPEEDWRDALSRAADEDNGIVYRNLTAEDIRPYDNAAGEVEYYRLELRLNKIGKAYLALNSYLEVPDDTWTKRIGDEDGDDDEGRGEKDPGFKSNDLE